MLNASTFLENYARVNMFYIRVDCHKNKLNLRIKTAPVIVGRYATAYVWLLCQIRVCSH